MVGIALINLESAFPDALHLHESINQGGTIWIGKVCYSNFLED